MAGKICSTCSKVWTQQEIFSDGEESMKHALLLYKTTNKRKMYQDGADAIFLLTAGLRIRIIYEKLGPDTH
jgi:hypothetical protein